MLHPRLRTQKGCKAHAAAYKPGAAAGPPENSGLGMGPGTDSTASHSQVRETRGLGREHRSLHPGPAWGPAAWGPAGEGQALLLCEDSPWPTSLPRHFQRARRASGPGCPRVSSSQLLGSSPATEQGWRAAITQTGSELFWEGAVLLPRRLTSQTKTRWGSIGRNLLCQKRHILK